jgi:hypothetical protein
VESGPWRAPRGRAVLSCLLVVPEEQEWPPKRTSLDGTRAMASSRGAQRRSNPGTCNRVSGLLRCARNDAGLLPDSSGWPTCVACESEGFGAFRRSERTSSCSLCFSFAFSVSSVWPQSAPGQDCRATGRAARALLRAAVHGPCAAFDLNILVTLSPESCS